MIKSLLKWKEFGDSDAPSITSGFSDIPDPNKDAIVKYLKNGNTILVSTGVGIDVFINEIVDNHYYLMTDGEYTWNNMIAYYVEKYNLKMPDDFINKVLESQRV